MPEPRVRIPHRIALYGALLLTILLALPLPLPGTFLVPTAHAAGSATLTQDATARFQHNITFTLSAQADSPIIDVELFWHPENDPLLQVGYPDFTVGSTVDTQYIADTSIGYLPPGIDIVYYWRITEQDGDISQSDPQRILYMDAGPDWQRKTAGQITVFWYGGGDDFGQAILDSATQAVERLSARFGVTATEPVRLVIYAEDDDFTNALPPNSADWIGGQAHPDLNLIVAEIDPNNDADEEIHRLVPHEISHLILHQATWNPFNSPPNWMDEGLAVFNQDISEPRMRAILDDARDDGRLIPVRALNSSFPLDPDQALLSYAESWSIVEYIVKTYGDDGLAALVAVFRDEVSYDEAVERALGVTLDELDAGWKADLGYAGDQAPVVPTAGADQPPAAADDSSDLTQNEAIFAGACAFIFALAGLALGVVAIRNIRRIDRERR